MNQEMRFSYEDPRGLKKNNWNPNQLSAESEAKLRKSIEENGILRPVVVRELEDGSLEIVGGVHRNDIFIEKGFEKVPVLNLGRVDDKTAKKALLLDNARYGEDDPTKLADLLSDVGTAKEIEQWLNMDLDDLETLIGLGSLEADELDLLDDLGDLEELDDEEIEIAPAKDLKTHQIMKFKVPVENAEMVKGVIDRIIKEQGIEDSDAGVKAGESLVWLAREYDLSAAEETHEEAEALSLDIESLMSEMES